MAGLIDFNSAEKTMEILPPERRRERRDFFERSVRCQCCQRWVDPGDEPCLDYGICDDCIECP